MFTTVISWLSQSIGFAYSIFLDFVTGSFFGLFISFFGILVVTRMILVPIIGSYIGFSASDHVKRDLGSTYAERERNRSNRKR